jgi:hypothetical protein
MGKKYGSGSGSGMNNPEHVSEMGWKKFGSGTGKIWIQDQG